MEMSVRVRLRVPFYGDVGQRLRHLPYKQTSPRFESERPYQYRGHVNYHGQVNPE